MCVEAPESTNHSEELGGYCCGTPVDWSAARKALWSQAVDGAGGKLGDACCWANMALLGWNGRRGPRTPAPGPRNGMDQAWTRPVHGL